MNCLICRNLERAYDIALSAYVEACSSASFSMCHVAARRYVDMERTRYDLEEHGLACTFANAGFPPLPDRGRIHELETISVAVSP